jgi:hypothetical protein
MAAGEGRKAVARPLGQTGKASGISLAPAATAAEWKERRRRRRRHNHRSRRGPRARRVRGAGAGGPHTGARALRTRAGGKAARAGERTRRVEEVEREREEAFARGPGDRGRGPAVVLLTRDARQRLLPSALDLLCSRQVRLLFPSALPPFDRSERVRGVEGACGSGGESETHSDGCGVRGRTDGQRMKALLAHSRVAFKAAQLCRTSIHRSANGADFDIKGGRLKKKTLARESQRALDAIRAPKFPDAPRTRTATGSEISPFPSGEINLDFHYCGLHYSAALYYSTRVSLLAYPIHYPPSPTTTGPSIHPTSQSPP